MVAFLVENDCQFETPLVGKVAYSLLPKKSVFN